MKSQTIDWPLKPLAPTNPFLRCGTECEHVYWEAANAEDVTILGARSGTLLLAGLAHQYISGNSAIVNVSYPQFRGIKPESVQHFDANNVPDALVRFAINRFTHSMGELKIKSECEAPCECVQTMPDGVNLGEATEDTEIDIEYSEIVNSGIAEINPRHPMDMPSLEDIIADNGKPIEFDPETDSLEYIGRSGTWRARWGIRRYFIAYVEVRVKHTIVRYAGTCMDTSEH